MWQGSAAEGEPSGYGRRDSESAGTMLALVLRGRMELGKKIAARLRQPRSTAWPPSGSPMPSAIGAIARSVLDLRETQLGRATPRSSWARDRASTGAGASIACAPHLPGHHRAADGALGRACAPACAHVVVSVDPHPERHVRWFGDPR